MRICFVNTKGGVGKTTASVFTASGLARHGRTVAVDTDPDASMQSWAAQANGTLGFTVIGLIRGIQSGIERIQREGSYDHLVIDTPPGYSDRELSRAALLACDAGVMPLSPRLLDADRLKATVDLLAQVSEVNPRLRPYVLLNQVRARTTMSKLVRDFLAAREFPMLPAISLREVYATAFGEPIRDLGEWGPVVDQLLKDAG